MCSIYCCSLMNKWWKVFLPSTPGLTKPQPSPCHPEYVPSVCLQLPIHTEWQLYICAFSGLCFCGYNCCVWVVGQAWVHYWARVSLAVCARKHVCLEPMTTACRCVLALAHWMSDYVHACGSVNWYAHMLCVIICIYVCKHVWLYM